MKIAIAILETLLAIAMVAIGVMWFRTNQPHWEPLAFTISAVSLPIIELLKCRLNKDAELLLVVEKQKQAKREALLMQPRFVGRGSEFSGNKARFTIINKGELARDVCVVWVGEVKGKADELNYVDKEQPFHIKID